MAEGNRDENSRLVPFETEKPDVSNRSSSLKNLVLANVIVGLWYVASSLYEPVLTQYVYHRVSLRVFGNDTRAQNFSTLAPCFQNTSDPGYILQETAQVESSQILLQFTVVYSAISVVSNLLFGTYSDFIGRKFVFVICICGYLLQNAITVTIIYCDLNLNYLYFAFALFGLSGGTWAFTLVSYAYTADNTPPHQSRSLWLAVIEAISGMSSALASLAGGFFIQGTGYFYPSLTAFIINVLALLIVIFCLKETRHRRPVSCDTLVHGVGNMGDVYCPNGTLKKVLIWLAVFIFFFSSVSNSSGSNIDTLFWMNLPFCWSPEKMGLFSTISYTVKNLVGVPIVKGLQVILSDEMIGVVSTMSAIGGSLVWAFAYNDWMMYIGVPLAETMAFAASPIIRGIMSRMVSNDKQGALFASLAIIQAISSTFGTPMFNKIYQSSVTYWPGLVFAAMAAMHVVALVLYWFFIPIFRRDQRDYPG